MRQTNPIMVRHMISTRPVRDQFGDGFAVSCSCGWQGPANGNRQQASAMRAQHQYQSGHGRD